MHRSAPSETLETPNIDVWRPMGWSVNDEARHGAAHTAQDVTATLDLALAASGLGQMTVVHRPRLLSDNGSSYVATDLAKWLDQQKMEHLRSAPYHPETQGKIERWGIRRSRTASCLSTTTCRALLERCDGARRAHCAN